MSEPLTSSTSPVAPETRFVDPAARRSVAWTYAVAIALTGGTLAVRLWVGPIIEQATLIVFTVPVIVSAYLGGLGPGVVATITACLGASYYLLAPLRSFAVVSQSEGWQLVILLFVGVLISVICEVLRRARGRAEACRRVSNGAQAGETLKALDMSEQRFRTTLDHLMEGCQIIGRDGLYLYVNASAARHGRRTAQDLVGRRIAEVFPGIEKTPMYAMIENCMAGGPAHEIENAFSYPDGSSAWFQLVIQPVPEGVFILSVDITERKLALRRLATQGAVSRVLADADSLQESMPRIIQALAESEGWDFGAVWEVDEARAVLHCRETWHRPGAAFDALIEHTRTLTLARGEGLPGRVWSSGQACLVPDVSADANYPSASFALQAGLHNALAFPIFQGGKVTGVIGFLAREISGNDEKLDELFGVIGRQLGLFIERRRVQDEVLRLNAELESRVMERTEQLELGNKELEAFSYSVSHDLRAPLRAVDGFSQALLEDFGEQLPAEGREFLNTIRGETQRMGDLIDDLLAFSRLSRAPINRQVIGVDSLVRGVVASLLAREPRPVIEIIFGPLPPCEGDAALLKQVWINLLSNALKYTGRRESPQIEIGSRMDANVTVYYVKDNGAGFDMRYADKLFGVFQRLHRTEDYEGTGVGLAIVQRIIHRHGGRIWAEAEIERGATFFFTLKQDSDL